MGINWHDVLDVLQHYVAVPLALPVALLVVAGITRGVRVVWFHNRQRGFPPIKVQTSPDGHSSEFAALLSAYLAQDTPDAVIVIPPGGAGPDAAYPVERLGNTSSWFRTATRIALSAEPTFEVHVKYVRADGIQAQNQATVRVTKTPRNRVVMATSLEHGSEEELVRLLGCRVSHAIHQTPAVLSNTPRWERWGAGWEGYFKYRSALEKEGQQNKYRSALKLYDEALRFEPGSFVVSMRKGALLELMQRYDEAVTVYRTCSELWNENIEARYRLAGALANGQHPEEAAVVLEDLNEHRLTWKNLWRNRLKSSFPRRNAGERRYWRGWLKRKFILFGPGRWQPYKTAVQVAWIITRVQVLESRCPTDTGLQDTLVWLMNITRKKARGSSYNRLLHPELGVEKLNACPHSRSWHDPDADKKLTINGPDRINKPRNGIGWLAHYNASICYSLLIGLTREKIPSGYDEKLWRLDCARAAILEIGTAKRDPRNNLEPGWYQTDPGLQPLRRFLRHHGKRWAEFVGLDPRIFGRRSYVALALQRRLQSLLHGRR